MSDVGDNNFVRYLYRGEENEYVPDDVTHVIVHEDVTVVRTRPFWGHLNITEVICHDKVEKIEEQTFLDCDSLRRVIMRGVKIIEQRAFSGCHALRDVEFGKLEIIEDSAFEGCESLRSINLLSTATVDKWAFNGCTALTDAKFGSKLERIEEGAFTNCSSLERITIPLKDGLITLDDTFVGCKNLKHVDLIEGALHETIAALLLEEWRDDMNEEIDSINEILPNTDAGGWDYNTHVYSVGEKALVIRRWIGSVLRKINHYITEHRRLLDEDVATTLELILPAEIVMNNVLPFLELPSHTFEVEEEYEYDDESE